MIYPTWSLLIDSLFVTRVSCDRPVGGGDPATTRVRKERFGLGEGGGGSA